MIPGALAAISSLQLEEELSGQTEAQAAAPLPLSFCVVWRYLYKALVFVYILYPIKTFSLFFGLVLINN